MDRINIISNNILGLYVLYNIISYSRTQLVYNIIYINVDTKEILSVNGMLTMCMCIGYTYETVYRKLVCARGFAEKLISFLFAFPAFCCHRPLSLPPQPVYAIYVGIGNIIW